MGVKRDLGVEWVKGDYLQQQNARYAVRCVTVQYRREQYKERCGRERFGTVHYSSMQHFACCGHWLL
jgi:hypothetical protein